MRPWKQSLFALVGTLVLASCAANSTPRDDAALSDEQEDTPAGRSAALSIGGNGIATCPGGGAPKCVACQDARTCTYSCSGGYTCDMDSGDGWHTCAIKRGCLSYSGGFSASYTFAQ